MTTDKKQSTQDVFLNHMRKNKISLTMFLVNGIKLQGIVTGFDNFAVMLRRESHLQLVYKHAISTIMPNEAVKFYDPEAEDADR
ncbi:MAG: RNA chaperone Hfq [Alphaproteobacteria bacterium]